jgi:hypothetical protein
MAGSKEPAFFIVALMRRVAGTLFLPVSRPWIFPNRHKLPAYPANNSHQRQILPGAFCRAAKRAGNDFPRAGQIDG